MSESRKEYDGYIRLVMVNPRVKSDRTSVIKATLTAEGTQQSGLPLVIYFFQIKGTAIPVQAWSGP
jgi:hypothetical protein